MEPAQQDRARQELSASYKGIMNSLAWRHLMEELDKIYADSYKAEDRCTIQDLTVGVAAQARGIRQGLDALKKQIQYATSEGQ
jgi:hypothetical protein